MTRLLYMKCTQQGALKMRLIGDPNNQLPRITLLTPRRTNGGAEKRSNILNKGSFRKFKYIIRAYCCIR